MTTHPEHRPPPPDDWQPASGGEVARLSKRMRGKKTRRQFLKAGGVVGGLLAVAGGWWAVRSATQEQEYDYGGITCHEAMARADAMMKGKKLSDAEMMQLKNHVMFCPNCKPRFERMGGAKMMASVVPVCRRSESA